MRLAVRVILALVPVTLVNAGFLDLSSVTPGSNGSFSGMLDGVTVLGSVTTTNPHFVFGAAGSLFQNSVIDNSSPQYSYGTVYSPAIALTDQVGYTTFSPTFNPATITITFGAAITNPVFEFANLDSMHYDFSPTAGLIGLFVLSGNGGADGDGLELSGTVVSDGDPSTIFGVLTTVPPPTSGPRSAYGSVELLGTFTSLAINVSNPASGGDSGSFTLASSTPEPGTLGFGLIGLLLLFGCSLLRSAGGLSRSSSLR
jgi:hypothetical protein